MPHSSRQCQHTRVHVGAYKVWEHKSTGTQTSHGSAQVKSGAERRAPGRSSAGSTCVSNHRPSLPSAHLLTILPRSTAGQWALLRITSPCTTSSSELLPILYCLRLFWSIVNEILLQTPQNRRARRSEAESISDPSWAIGMWKGREEKNQRLSHITKADTWRLPLTDHVTVHESVTLPWNKCSPKTATS